jgi:hypothetical protein
MKLTTAIIIAIAGGVLHLVYRLAEDARLLPSILLVDDILFIINRLSFVLFLIVLYRTIKGNSNAGK